MKKKSESVSVLEIQKTLKTNLLQSRMKSEKKFIPFINQRNLGKLIKEETDSKIKKKIQAQDINFRNFKDIYRKQSKLQQQRYSNLTRNSQQPDLLSERGWTKKKLASLSENKHEYYSGRKCFGETSQQLNKLQRKENKFGKIDMQLYKKIMVSKPKGINNPEVQKLFNHYAQTCELNENIRRKQLTQKKVF